MKLKLIYEMASFYDDETENMKSDKIDYAEGDTIEEMLESAAEIGSNFDDEDTINFSAKSDLIETTFDLKQIFILENDSEIDVTEQYITLYNEYLDNSF
jgi:hypothetical protein